MTLLKMLLMATLSPFHPFNDHNACANDNADNDAHDDARGNAEDDYADMLTVYQKAEDLRNTKY